MDKNHIRQYNNEVSIFDSTIPCWINYGSLKPLPIPQIQEEGECPIDTLIRQMDHDMIRFTPDEMIAAMERVNEIVKDPVVEIGIEYGYYGDMELRMKIIDE